MPTDRFKRLSNIRFFAITALAVAVTAASCTGTLDIWCGISIELPEDLENPVVVLSGVGPDDAALNEQLPVSGNQAAGIFRGLTPGLWSFDAQVIVDEAVVLEGSADAEIEAAQSALVDIVLEPVTGAGDVIITVPDDVPPSNVTNFQAVSGALGIDLSWDNPLGDTDFAGASIWRSSVFYPALPHEASAIEVYNGSETSHADTGVVSGVAYYYTIFSYDSATPRNYSSGAMKEATAQ